MRIFISYRRADSDGHAGRLRDDLASLPGVEHVFQDVEGIRAGETFWQRIQREIADADVMIVVIGRTWLDAGDGVSRLDDPDDYVRREIELGIARGQDLLVVPLLVSRATLPTQDQLPESLRPLLDRNAFELRNWDHDLQLLTEHLGLSKTPPWGRWVTIAVAALIVTGVAVMIVPPLIDGDETETSNGAPDAGTADGGTNGGPDPTDGGAGGTDPNGDTRALACSGTWLGRSGEQTITLTVGPQTSGCLCGRLGLAPPSSAGLQEELYDCATRGDRRLLFRHAEITADDCDPTRPAIADLDAAEKEEGAGWLSCELYSATAHLFGKTLRLMKKGPRGEHPCLGLWSGRSGRTRYVVELQSTDARATERCGFWTERASGSAGEAGPSLVGCRAPNESSIAFQYGCYEGCDGIEDVLETGSMACTQQAATLKLPNRVVKLQPYGIDAEREPEPRDGGTTPQPTPKCNAQTIKQIAYGVAPSKANYNVQVTCNDGTCRANVTGTPETAISQIKGAIAGHRCKSGFFPFAVKTQ